MLSIEVQKLETENRTLRQEVADLRAKLAGMMTRSDQATCESCRYFKRHYIRTDSGFHELYEGHCTRTLKRKELDETCRQFEPIRS